MDPNVQQTCVDSIRLFFYHATNVFRDFKVVLGHIFCRIFSKIHTLTSMITDILTLNEI